MGLLYILIGITIVVSVMIPGIICLILKNSTTTKIGVVTLMVGSLLIGIPLVTKGVTSYNDETVSKGIAVAKKGVKEYKIKDYTLKDYKELYKDGYKDYKVEEYIGTKGDKRYFKVRDKEKYYLVVVGKENLSIQDKRNLRDLKVLTINKDKLTIKQDASTFRLYDGDTHSDKEKIEAQRDAERVDELAKEEKAMLKAKKELGKDDGDELNKELIEESESDEEIIIERDFGD